MRLFTTGLLLFFMTFLLAQTTHQVVVTSNVFTPNSLTIQVGDIVNWTNNGGFHNINGSQTAYPNNPESFANGNAAPAGWMFDFTFNTPGTYDYHCDPHQGLGMTGTIIVEDGNMAVDNVVITEISYNPPESGTDSLEFIEFINISLDPVNLMDWTMSDGVDFTFPDVTLASGEFMVLAVNEVAFMTVFPNYTGTLLQWTGGGLSNGGENIAISNAAGVVVDEVEYDDASPWPTSPDGNGTTLVLCDFAGDNNSPFSWQAASTSTGVTINGIEFFANPGAASECGVQAPQLYFLTDNMTLNEGDGTVTVEVIAQGFDTGIGPDFQVVFDVQSTVTEAADFSTEPALPISFIGEMTSLDTFSFTVTVIDDTNAEMEENLVLRIVSPSATSDSLIFITIRDNDSEVVVTPIDNINDLDADGNAISLEQTVTLQGVVHCLDFRGGEGYQFWIIEPNGDGINVFGFSDVDGYVVTEGDELQVTGELDQFNGLLEIIPTFITILSTGNDLVAPITVNTLSEEVESKLVTLEIVGLGGDDAIFATGTSGANAVVVTATNDTFEIRAEVETGIDSTFLADFFAMGGGAYNVTGLVSQRDFEAPLDGFYQLLPCSTDDFSVGSNVTEPVWASDLEIYPNPTSGLLQINASINLEVIRLVDLTGRELQRSNVNGQQQRLNISNLPTGTYFLQLISGNEVVTRPIVKQ